MNDQTDSQLLDAWAETRSEPAFAELVRRHVNLVYSAALRMVCDFHHAEDVTQGVFLALAQNARHLENRSVLSGWLHGTARNLAANAVRSDVRRRAREQEAATMNELLAENGSGAGVPPAWSDIAPHLDAALGELSEPDRDAMLLRFFENKTLTEVGAVLVVSEDAARMRVNRALEKLRDIFAKRGVTVGAGGLVLVISANAVQAAPAGLAAAILTAATLAGTTLATTATAIAIKTIAMTTLQKTVIGTALAVAIGTGIYETLVISRLREQNQTLQQQQAPLAEQIQQLQHERDDATNRLTGLLAENAQLKSEQDKMELLKLRGEVGMLRRKASDLAQLLGDMQNARQQNHPALPTHTREAALLAIASSEAQLKSNQDKLDVANQKVEQLLTSSRVPDEVSAMDVTMGLDNVTLKQYWPFFEAKRERDQLQRFVNLIKLKIATEKTDLSLEATKGDSQ